MNITPDQAVWFWVGIVIIVLLSMYAPRVAGLLVILLGTYLGLRLIPNT